MVGDTLRVAVLVVVVVLVAAGDQATLSIDAEGEFSHADRAGATSVNEVDTRGTKSFSEVDARGIKAPHEAILRHEPIRAGPVMASHATKEVAMLSGDACILEKLANFEAREFQACHDAERLGCKPCTRAPSEHFPYVLLAATSATLACVFYLVMRACSVSETFSASQHDDNPQEVWAHMNSEMPNEKQGELHALHLARFVSALHKFEHDFFFFAENSAVLHNFCTWGFTQVELFFFLSGFVHTYSAIPTASASLPWSAKMWSAQRWLRRAYPVMVIVHLVGFLVVPYANGAAFPLFWDLKSQLQDLTLVTSWNPGHYCSTRWNLPAWFMSTLVALGFFFPIWQEPVQRLNIRGCLVALFICTLLTSVPYAVQTHLGFNIFSSITTDLGNHHFMSQAKLHPLSQYPIYVGGMVAAQLHVALSRMESRQAHMGVFTWVRCHGACLAVAVLAAGFICTTPWKHFLLWQCGGLLPLYVLLVLGLAGGQDPIAKATGHSSLRWLGQLTLPLFLLQHPVVNTLQVFWGSQLSSLAPPVADLLQVVAVLLATLAVHGCSELLLGRKRGAGRGSQQEQLKP